MQARPSEKNNVESQLLDALDSSDVTIRASAAANVFASGRVLRKALKDSTVEVRWQAINNAAASESVLMAALLDLDEQVRQSAQQKLAQYG